MGIRSTLVNLASGLTRGARGAASGQYTHKSDSPRMDAPIAYYLSPNGDVQAIKTGIGYAGAGNFNYSITSPYADIPIQSNPTGFAYASIVSTWANRCIDIRKSTINRIPYKIVKRSSGEAVPDHPLAIALKRANSRGQKIFAKHEWSKCVWGETFLYPVKNQYGYNSDIVWLNNLGMEVITLSGYIGGYTYAPINGGRAQTFEPDEIAFLYTDNPFNDLRGLSPFDTILLEVGVDKDIARYVKAWYTNDARPGLMLLPETDLGAVPAQEFMDYWKANFQGPKNAGKPVLMPHMIKDVKEIQQAPKIDDVELRLAVRTEICAKFGVPLAIAGAWDDANYDSVDTQRKSLYEETIIPETEDIDDDFSELVMPFFDEWGDCKLVHDFSSIQVLMEDEGEKTDALNAKLAAGGIMLSEYRAQLDLPPIPNSEIFFRPAGITVVPLANVGQPTAPEVPTTQPTAPAAPVLEVQPPAIEADKAVGKPTCIMLKLGANPDLLALQSRVKEMYADSPVRWNTPDDFHVTLLYAPNATPEQVKALTVALQAVDPSAMQLGVGSLRTFDNVGEHAVHFRISRNNDLLDLQETIYDAAVGAGVAVSSYSVPAAYTPHVTMGYAENKPRPVTFQSKLKVSPTALVLMDGDTVAYERSLVETPAPVTPAVPAQKSIEDELAAWEKCAKNNHAKAIERFEVHTIPAPLAELIRGSLETGIAVKDVFASARERLAGKAIQATRLDFENTFADLLAEAVRDNIDRRTFAASLRSLLNTTGRKAYMDGLKDGGVDITDYAELDDEDKTAIAELLAEQSQFVTNIGATIYKGDGIDTTQLDGKPALWFTGSVKPFYDTALTNADRNGMYEVVRKGATEDPCPECEAMEGQIHRRKDYARKNLLFATVGQATTCEGWECAHVLVRTTGKARGNWT